MEPKDNIIRNPLHDQDLLNEIKDQFNLNCDCDYVFYMFLLHMNTHVIKQYIIEDFHKLIDGLDDESITYVKSFLLKVILKNHPDYKELYPLYSKTILSYVVPDHDWEITRYPQKVFFAKEFLEKQKKYNLDNFYSLVVKDAGVKYLPESVIPKIKEGAIIDGGSYNAETAVVLSDYTDKKVYAFDFVKKHLTLMEDKIKFCHKEDQVEIVPLGISDMETQFSIKNDICSMDANLKGMDESQHAESGSYLVKTTSIDTFVRSKNREKISLIKLDIEGFEQKAIQGMKELLQRDKPILLISIYHHIDDFISIKTILNDMNLGYKFKIRHIDPIFYYNQYQKSHEIELQTFEYMLFAYTDD